MTKIADKFAEDRDHRLVICDFSPPRGSDTELLEPARHLDVDWISVAYNPGKSTRVNSAIAAHWIKTNANKDVVFTLATRDMNKVAMQSLLLGAQLLGLENIVIVKGDDFSQRERSIVKDVNDYTPTGLLEAVHKMNQGIDYKGWKLREPTNFCVGATLDLGRDMEREVRLTRKKIEAGAQFLISQPTFDSNTPRTFLQKYSEHFGQELTTPIFHGVQIMAQESIVFGNIPQWVTRDIEKGRTGQHIALEMLNDFSEAGLHSIYLVPPILRGGQRDYEAAQEVLESMPR